MTQGLYSAVTGIQGTQSQMDVISNNIANMNTVGFKASEVNFEALLSKTLSQAASPTASLGGTNPIQVGLGSSIAEITTNFTNGTVESTGIASDLDIQGNGFFTLADSSGNINLSRAGDFSLDANGNLVSSNGCKVLGTSNISSPTASTTNIVIPQSLNITSPVATDSSTNLNDISASGTAITNGIFTLNIADPGNSIATIPEQVTITSGESMSQLETAIGTAVDTALGTSGTTTAIDTTGKMIITPASPTATIDFSGQTTDTSNFLSVADFTSAAGSAPFTSSALIDNSSVTIASGDTSSNSYSLSSYSIGTDGAIKAVYSNGDSIAVTGTTSRQLLFTSSTGNEISSANIINNAGITPAQLQLQLSNVTNSEALISKGGNMFAVGPNTGTQIFGIAGSQALGTIDAGALESSNVDLTTELANLIVAQRSIDANSRTFTAENTIMQDILQIGR